jgi:ABC-type siderophore export system fused ATPase/permease subunit
MYSFFLSASGIYVPDGGKGVAAMVFGRISMVSCLDIKEMQIKITAKFHLTPVRIAITKTPTLTNVGEDGREKGTLIYC